MAKQEQAKRDGEMNRYKGYNVLGNGKIKVNIVVGEDGEIYQSIPTDEVAYHAGENKVNKFIPGIQDKLNGHPNSRTIGIEMDNLGSIGYN